MEAYQIQIINHHIIATIQDKKALIDTGAPSSIGNDGQPFCLLGKQYNFSSIFMGLAVSQLSEFIGTNIDFLIGGDVLGEVCFTVDWGKRQIEFASTSIPFDGTSIPVDVFMNIPIIQFDIDDTKVRAFLDTGAKLSYLSQQITKNHESIGDVFDFYPGVGQFSTPTYKIPIGLVGETLEVTFGNLPELLETTLMMSNTNGILGNDIFKYYSICFDLKNAQIILKKRN